MMFTLDNTFTLSLQIKIFRILITPLYNRFYCAKKIAKKYIV